MSVFEEISQRLGGKLPPLEAERPEILLVDDDPGICRALEFAFREQFGLVVVNDPRDAVSRLSDETLVIVLDIKMAHMNGFEVCDALRAVAPHVPVIFHSAFQDAKDPFEIINQHRPFAFITKNGDVSMLKRAVKRAVAHAKIVQARIRTRAELAKALASLQR